MDDLQALEAALLSGMDGQSDSLEPLCSIDPTTRRITVPDNVFGVESDEQAKRVYFSVPTVVGDNFDLSKARIQINFRNPNGDLGVYLVKDFAADAEGNATFSWSLRRIVTQYKGTVSFIVCATIAAGNNRIDREWNTTLAQGQVLEGLEVTQEMESLAHDIIGQLILAADEADSAASAAVNQVAAAAQTQKDAAITAIRTESISQQNTITKKAQEALRDIPESYVELSNQVNQMSEDLQGMAPAIIPTATGSIVTIADGAARPAVELISHIEPVQEGSGDPSPDNVRPISGWNSVTAQRKGKNLLPVNSVDASQNQAGLVELTYLPAGTYVLSVDITKYADDTATNTRVGCSVEYTDGTTDKFFSGEDTQNAERDGVTRKKQVPFNIREDKTINNIYIWLLDYSGAFGARNAKAENAQLEQGNVVTPFAPYQGKTLSATLTETVYGGKKNWTTGVIQNKAAYTRLKDLAGEWTLQLDVTNDTTLLFATVLPNVSNADRSKAICTHLPNYGSNPQMETARECIGFHEWQPYKDYFYIRINRDRLSSQDTAGLEKWLTENDVALCYYLDNASEIQLTPQQLDTLYGTNNVWSNCGDTTLSYVADTELWATQKFAAIAAAMLAN